MNIDLTPIFQALIGLLAVLITTKLIPWIKARTSIQQQSMIAMATRTFVFAAEQLYGVGTGTEKMKYVKKKLEEHGYTVDVAVIEAAIREMNIEEGWIESGGNEGDESGFPDEDE